MSWVVLHKCTGVIFGITQKPASWRLKNKSYFPNHDMLIRTLLSDKFYGAITIKLGQITGYKLTYRDLGNMTYFSIFTMQIFPPSQKNMIPKYNAVSYSWTDKLFFCCCEKQFQYASHWQIAYMHKLFTQNRKFYKFLYLINF